MNDRLQQQLTFLNEIEQLKAVHRRNRTVDGGRFENSAEHSWHVALMALLLLEHADEPVSIDPLRVVRMLLVHDLIEIDAGDTWLYDAEGSQTQATREAQSAERLFALLPEDQASEWRALWEEFEFQHSADARYARAIDGLQPLTNHLHVHNKQAFSGDARPHHDQVMDRKQHIGEASAVLWNLAQQLISESTEKGLYESKGEDRGVT
jgi:putative hydrolase of HD superfamily